MNKEFNEKEFTKVVLIDPFTGNKTLVAIFVDKELAARFIKLMEAVAAQKQETIILDMEQI